MKKFNSNMMQVSLDDWSERIKQCIISGNHTPFKNEYPSHAKRLIALMIESAENSIIIYNRKLNGIVWNSDEILVALKHKKHLSPQMVFEQVCNGGEYFIEESSPFLNTIKVEDEIKKSNFNANFILIDDKRYRFEIECSEYNALACMNCNDKEMIDNLKSIFRDAWEYHGLTS